jgi:hypothetical protein
VDLGRVDVVLAGQLVDRSVCLVGRQGDLGLEPGCPAFLVIGIV